PVTDSDLRRLSSAGCDVSDCVGWVSVESFESSYPDVRLNDGYQYMTLRRLDDGTCVLAREEEGNLRCSVHGSHPIVCRLYPYDEKNGGVRGRKLCRRTSRPREDLRSLGLLRRGEAEEYSRKVSLWNRSAFVRRGREDFLKYLLAGRL
ncbi:MAG: hypothetical protein V1744_07535, partial [Candidatus Altiarchaeota archaeon]